MMFWIAQPVGRWKRLWRRITRQHWSPFGRDGHLRVQLFTEEGWHHVGTTKDDDSVQFRTAIPEGWEPDK